MKIPHEKLDPRAAGDIERYHNERMLQRQTVAHHSWNVARILLAIWPEVPRHVLVEALFHDVGEGFAGDSPHPAKHGHPPLGVAVQEAENAARLAMALPWGVPPQSQLTEAQESTLHLIDLVEAWEHLLFERAYGSLFAEVMIERCDLEIKRRLTFVPSHVGLGVERYLKKRQQEEMIRAAPTHSTKKTGITS